MVKIIRLDSDEAVEKAEDITKIRKDVFQQGIGRQEMDEVREFLKLQDYALIASDLGKIVGYILGKKVDDRRGSVSSVGVSKKYQRQGIGEMLLLNLHDTMREDGLTIVELTVGANWTARFLYKKRGYHKLFGKYLSQEVEYLRELHRSLGVKERGYDLVDSGGRIRRHYPTGEDALLMEKNLAESSRSPAEYLKVAQKYFSDEVMELLSVNELIDIATELTVPLKKFSEACWSLYVLSKRESTEAVRRYSKSLRSMFKDSSNNTGEIKRL
jgi:ribosomal protein S18 acetylase RimI-like enzyme